MKQSSFFECCNRGCGLRSIPNRLNQKGVYTNNQIYGSKEFCSNMLLAKRGRVFGKRTFYNLLVVEVFDGTVSLEDLDEV